MALPLTRKLLIDWGGERALKDAERLVEKGMVLEAVYTPPNLSGAILRDNRAMKTSATVRPNGGLDSHCPCYTNRERGVICDHILAVALTVVQRAADPLREAKHKEELRRASRLAAVDESKYIRRVPATDMNAVPARLHLSMNDHWQEEWKSGTINLTCEIGYRDQLVSLDRAPRDIPFSFQKKDESLLFVLEDISEGPAQGCISMGRSDFLNVVRLRAGNSIATGPQAALSINETPVTTFIRMDLDRENGEILLFAHTELPFLKPGEFPVYLVDGRSGWAVGADHSWPLANVLPRPYHPIYEEPVVIPRCNTLTFFRQELPALEKHARIETDLSVDLFTVDPAEPRFRLQVNGSPASLSVILYALYDDIQIVVGKPNPNGHFALPDPDDLMRYLIRNDDRERQALEILSGIGFTGQCGDDLNSLVGSREVLNFLGSGIPLLRRKGWDVELNGKIEPFAENMDFATPVVHVNESASGEWFDVAFDFEDREGCSISQSDIQRALRLGDGFLKQGNRTILLDSDAVESMQDVFSDCGTLESDKPGHFRMPGVYAPFVKSSLDGLDGIDIEDTAEWRDLAGRQNRTVSITPAPLEQPLKGILRPYQAEGVDWLYFLERSGFAGLLADEMGLGKTIQTLAWLTLPRARTDADKQPTLIVCPTSLVDNWAAEAKRFVPEMKVLQMSGSERHALWNTLDESDIVVTSYALLRRDQDSYAQQKFAVAVLDEAQHIKNRSTQNAKAAKKIPAEQKLVLTGTPIENSVADLWSIMDFLMPGYLGAHDTFRDNYERPIARGGQDAEMAQKKLRRKLHPFMLRRLKTVVAKDLPPKIEKVSLCPLSPDQKAVYAELLASSQRKVSSMVKKKGFQKSRMEILTTLMRLRQASCHLDMLKLPDLKAERPSGKMELFLELIDEAVDAGHRVLVFSQFVSMLSILKKELADRDLTFCYLDGSTKDRGAVVKQFNTDRTIPLFLISLKAGGTGLNLTGADMVIHFDPWWNPAVENQATNRAHRIGQKNTVYSVKLIAEGTVEEKVLELQKKKKAVIDATVESDEAVLKTMSWDDVAELLDL